MSPPSSPIPVGVLGALGKMGQEVVKTLSQQSDMKLVMAVDRQRSGESIDAIIGLTTPTHVTVSDQLDSMLATQKPRVVVDFTSPQSVFNNAKLVLEAGIHCVIGTTGLAQSQLETLKAIADSHKVTVFVVPNFSIGAVLLMRFAQQASRYFSHAELIELHHNQKLDAPSGTSLRTAEMMGQACAAFGPTNTPNEEELIMGARGADGPSGLHIHSVRLPGLVAHQEVLFGATGELLTLRHDSFDRRCFMPGVLLAIQFCLTHSGLFVGLEQAMSSESLPL